MQKLAHPLLVTLSVAMLLGLAVPVASYAQVLNAPGTFPVGVNPTGVAFNGIDGTIWVANFTSSTVSKLQATTGTLLGTYYVGLNPIGVTVDVFATNDIWVKIGRAHV